MSVNLILLSSIQTLLQHEKESFHVLQQKYGEAQESSEARHKKLEETEGRLQQLQESLHRYLDIFRIIGLVFSSSSLLHSF